MPKRGKARSGRPGGQQQGPPPANNSHAQGPLAVEQLRQLLESDSSADRWQKADFVASVSSLLLSVAQVYEGLDPADLTGSAEAAAAWTVESSLVPLLGLAMLQVADLLQQQHKLLQQQAQQEQEQQEPRNQVVRVPGRLLVCLFRCLLSVFAFLLQQKQTADPTAADTLLAGARLSVAVLLSHSTVSWDGQQQLARVVESCHLTAGTVAMMALQGEVPGSGSPSNGSASNGSGGNGSGGNGSASNGSASNGSTSNGSASNGSTSNGNASNDDSTVCNLLLDPAAVQLFVLLLLIDAQACSTWQRQQQLQQAASSSSSSPKPAAEPSSSSQLVAAIKAAEGLPPEARDTLLATYEPLEIKDLVSRVAIKMQVPVASLQQLADAADSKGLTGHLFDLACSVLPRVAYAALLPVDAAEPAHQQQQPGQQRAESQHSHQPQHQQQQPQQQQGQRQQQQGQPQEQPQWLQQLLQQQEQQEYRVVESLQGLLGPLAWDLPPLLLAVAVECGRSSNEPGLSTSAASAALLLLKVWRWCSQPVYAQMLLFMQHSAAAAAQEQQALSAYTPSSCPGVDAIEDEADSLLEAAIEQYSTRLCVIHTFGSVLHHWECLARAELARFAAALSSSSSSSTGDCSRGSSGVQCSSSSSTGQGTGSSGSGSGSHDEVDKQLCDTMQTLAMLTDLLPITFDCCLAVSDGPMHPVQALLCAYSSTVTTVLEQLVRQVLSARSSSSGSNSGSSSSGGSSATATYAVYLEALSTLRSLDKTFSQLLQLEAGEVGWLLSGAGGTTPAAAERQQQVFSLAVSLLKLLGSNHISIHVMHTTHMSLGNLGPSIAHLLSPATKVRGCSLAASRAALAPWLVLWGRYLLNAAVQLQQAVALADEVFTTGVRPGCTSSSDSKGDKGSSGSSSGSSLEERLELLARTPLQFVAGTVAQIVFTGVQAITSGEDSVRSCYSSYTEGLFTGTNTFPVPGEGQQEQQGTAAAAAGVPGARKLLPRFHLQHPGLPVELLQTAAGDTTTAAAGGSGNGSSSSSRMLSCVLLDDLDDFSDAHLQPLQQLCEEVVLLSAQCVEVYTCSCCDETVTSVNTESLTALLHSPALRQLPAVLHAAGTALCSLLPVPWLCNNPACTNMDRESELLLVGGKGCVCASCKVARYCGRACQVAHWKLHKPVCKRLAARAAAGAAEAAPAGPAEAAA